MALRDTSRESETFMRVCFFHVPAYTTLSRSGEIEGREWGCRGHVRNLKFSRRTRALHYTAATIRTIKI